jgi:hypothetical protein
LDRLQLYELVRKLSPDERRILIGLRDRGPALPLEIAVRVLKMPEEVAQPLQYLGDLGLVQTNGVGDNPFGGNVLRLSDLGAQVVTILKDRTLLSEIDAAVVPPAPQAQEAALAFSKGAADPREREIALLLQLADLAKQSGDLAKATEWTEQALVVQRALAGK